MRQRQPSGTCRAPVCVPCAGFGKRVRVSSQNLISFETRSGCDTCGIVDSDCRRNATVDEKTCSCEKQCPNGFKGRFCETCDRTKAVCLNSGTLNANSCRCQGCAFPFEGEFCEKCALQASDCLHSGRLCPKKCKCKGCDKPWTGRRCEKCGLKAEHCGLGGRVDATGGQCKCKCVHPGWSGDTCEVCTLDPHVCGEGTHVDLKRCQCMPGAAKAAGAAPGMRFRAVVATLEGACALSEAACGEGTRMDRGACKCQRVAGAVDEVLEVLEAKPMKQDLPVARVMRFKEMATTLKVASRRASAAWRAMGTSRGGRDPAGTLVTCTFSGVPDKVIDFIGTKSYYGRRREGYYQHLFTHHECTGGRVPNPLKGQWFGAVRSYYHCGEDEQWSVLAPDEIDGPGVMWYNANPCGGDGGAQGLASVSVNFFLPNSESSQYLHRCAFEGEPERYVKRGNCTGRPSGDDPFKDFKGFNG